MMEGDYDTRAKSYEDQILHMIRIEDREREKTMLIVKKIWWDFCCQ